MCITSPKNNSQIIHTVQILFRNLKTSYQQVNTVYSKDIHNLSSE